MKRFISLILILCFYTQSININNLIYVGLNQAKATSPEALNTEITEAVPVMMDVLTIMMGKGQLLRMGFELPLSRLFF